MQSPYQVLLFLFFHFSLPASSLLFPEARLLCSPANSPHDPTFISDFVTVMESLAHRITTVGWAAHASGSVYGLGQCLSDLSQSDCALCFAQARTKLPSCLPSNAGRIFLDGCFLRYDNYSFFAEPIDPQHDCASCGSNSINGKAERSLFALNVNHLLKNVTDTAVRNHSFAAGLRGNVHGLAQCWKSVEKEGCRECLEKAGREVMGCLPSDEGRGLNAGCYLRYSIKNVYSQAQNMVEGQQRKHQEASPKSVFLLAIAASVFSAVLLSVLGVCIGYGKFSERKQVRTNLGKLSSAVMKSNLNFKYEMLEKATEFFNPSRKLGQGGAGSVYRGILPDGRTVAVKRLSFSTRQWVDEFFNEVNLISGVQHKNLVQLLGCSIEGPESLLVYEYVRNKSLDQFLFNKSKTGVLSWQKRFEIIVGIAEGLAYLHEGSGMRIIHRDIKSSNILLDENLNPKIADFGLARCVSADRSHLSTGIAGTLGYMAPEYLVRGQLTEKADVYSFGVLVLEIVCGRKNSVYAEESSSILQMVWNCYKSNTLPDVVDECLKRQFPAEAASKVFQIGLLCTQASVPLRPSMSGVVQMLTEDNCPIPSPKQPPFLNASMGDPNASSVSMSFPSSASPATSYGLTTPTSEQK